MAGDPGAAVDTPDALGHGETAVAPPRSRRRHAEELQREVAELRGEVGRRRDIRPVAAWSLDTVADALAALGAPEAGPETEPDTEDFARTYELVRELVDDGMDVAPRQEGVRPPWRDLLARMEGHQFKKASRMRALHTWAPDAGASQ